MDSKRIICERLLRHQQVIGALLADEAVQQAIADTAAALEACFRRGNKVYFCGNGGSAADAQHLAAEFSGKFYLDRAVLPSEALHCNTSYLTAVGNDYSFDIIYSRLISGAGVKGDVLVGLSTSGNSRNIVEAFKTCREKGIVTVGLTGAAGGRMAPLSDYLVAIPAADTPRIQEAHITVGHIICEMVESSIFGK